MLLKLTAAVYLLMLLGIIYLAGIWIFGRIAARLWNPGDKAAQPENYNPPGAL